jgi:hypothetical protein
VVGSHVHGNEPLCSIKGRKYHEYHLNKDSGSTESVVTPVTSL